MSNVVYALFENREQAEEAARHAPTPSAPAIETGHFHDDELPLGATRATAWMMLGGFGVGFTGATIFSLVVAPLLGTPVSVYEWFLMSMAGFIFGIVGGAVSGAAVARRPLESLRSAVEHSGKTAVILDAGEFRADAAAALERGGATEVRAA